VDHSEFLSWQPAAAADHSVLLAWTWRNERVRPALITLLNFAILYTGFGLFIGLLTPVLLVFDYRGELNRSRKARLIGRPV